MKMPQTSVKSRIATVAVAATLASGATLPTAGHVSAQSVTPSQLSAAGWTCIRPLLFPTLLLCATPGVGFPPLVGSPGFADRLPSYQALVFDFSTDAFLGTQHLVRPDIYEQGTPPCPQQPTGEFFYNPRNDMWICSRLNFDPSS